MSQYVQVTQKPYGVVSDVSPFDVEMEWTDVKNMSFNDLSVSKISGDQQLTVPPVEPYHLLFNGSHTSLNWYYMGDGTIHQTDFTNDVDLDALASINVGTNWDASLFNLFPVFNNTVDAPWTLITGTQVESLPAFPASTSCEAIRPYRTFLVALNTTTSAVNDGNRLIWSDSSDAGALPASWDIADPDILAGDAYLTSSKGEIIDGLQLRDLFVIYKTHATYIMRLIGGQTVMRIDKIQTNSGILAKNCVAEFKGVHFVVSDGDIVLFDGQSVKSIAEKKVRRKIFASMDSSHYRNSYVTRYDRKDEMWFCYPENGREYPNKAAIWNWKDDTWTFRDLAEFRHLATGQIPGTSFTYDSPEAQITYDSVAAQQPYITGIDVTDTLVMAAPSKLGKIAGFNSFGNPMVSLLEKTTMALDSEDIKIVKTVIPRIIGDNGTKIYIRIGSQDNPDDQIFWHPEQLYVLGVDRETYHTAKGRYISLRFRTDELDANWELVSYRLELAESGRY